jgi:hypothetical protein
MSAGRKKLLFILLAIAVVLWVAGIAAIPIVEGLDPKTKTDNIILNGIPFILIFIGIIIAFIDFTILMATLWNNKISEDVHRPIERALIIGIVVGIVGLFQPIAFLVYTAGFPILFLSTIGFIFWSHIVPRASARG